MAPFPPADDADSLRDQAALVLAELGVRQEDGGRLYEDDRVRIRARYDDEAEAGLEIAVCGQGRGIRVVWSEARPEAPFELEDADAAHLAGLAERAAEIAALEEDGVYFEDDEDAFLDDLFLDDPADW